MAKVKTTKRQILQMLTELALIVKGGLEEVYETLGAEQDVQDNRIAALEKDLDTILDGHNRRLTALEDEVALLRLEKFQGPYKPIPQYPNTWPSTWPLVSNDTKTISSTND